MISISASSAENSSGRREPGRVRTSLLEPSGHSVFSLTSQRAMRPRPCDGSLRSFGEKAKKNEFKHWCFIYEREKTDRFVLTEDGFKILNNRLIDEHFRGDYGTIDTASYSITLENDKIKSIDKSFHGETQTAMFSMVTTSSFSLFGKSVVELPEQLQVIFPSSEEV